MMYFDDLYNDAGFSSDMFITSFCHPIGVGIAPDPLASDTDLFISPTGGGAYAVTGTEGSNVVLWNVLGQRLREFTNRDRQRVLTISLDGYSDGVYIIKSGVKTRKFFHSR